MQPVKAFPHHPFQGFTLAELLVCLAILGMIATYAIPKVLNAQSTGKNNAIAKEAIAMISQAHQAYRMNRRMTVSATGTFISSYLPANLNYIRYETTAAVSIDANPPSAGTPMACNILLTGCYRLHNGALLLPIFFSLSPPDSMAGPISFYLDPDGAYTGQGDGLIFVIDNNGRVMTEGDRTNDSSQNPSWFHW